ncbi:MAG: hypothetical protein ACE5F5_05510 [Acidimicrobiia bacterium]
MSTLTATSVARKAGLALVVAALAVLGVTAMSPATGNEQVSAYDVVGELSRDSTPSDVLDSRFDPGLIVEGSSRLLFRDSRSSHWVSVASTGDVCLSSLYDEGSSQWTAGTTCIAPNYLQEGGLRLSQGLGTPTSGSDVTLIADGIANEQVRRDVEEAGGAIPVDNLVVFPVGHRPGVLTVEGLDGGSLELGSGK